MHPCIHVKARFFFSSCGYQWKLPFLRVHFCTETIGLTVSDRGVYIDVNIIERRDVFSTPDETEIIRVSVGTGRAENHKKKRGRRNTSREQKTLEGLLQKFEKEGRGR